MGSIDNLMSIDILDLARSTWRLTAALDEPSASAVPGDVRDALSQGIPATVPGVVHTDLLDASLIPDPYVGLNEGAQAWVGDQTWRYTTHIELAASDPALDDDHTDLVCEGLDTVATISVNGEVVGRTANQHRSFRFPVKHLLHEGDNELVIEFSPALEAARATESQIGALPHVEKYPFNMIRKMACNFGWDWGPALITAGVWKPIRLESWSVARIASASLLATTTPASEGRFGGLLDLTLDLEGELRFAALTVRVSGPGVTAEAGFQATETTTYRLDLSQVQPWWPHSMGDQPLYDVEIVLHNDVAVLDTIHRRVGFRTVVLDTTPDPQGGGARFVISINGVEMFARGADWIPDDCFPSRITAERYRERLEQTREANIDFLRIWGGGIFEADAFYDACDELGIAVWQDMLLACAAYPEVDPIRSEIEAEVRDNVVRLSPHPSLIIWNGCNENLWGFDSWGWVDTLQGRAWGAGYYYGLFPQIIAELDPSRPYWFGSPSSGQPAIHANNDNFGPVHIWDVWNAEDYTHYMQYSPRFVAEFGFQGPATWATWNHVVPAEERYADSPTMAAHEKAANGLAKLARGLREHLPAPAEGPEGFDDWLFLTQLNQARAVRFGIEWWRSMRGRCMGTVVWQINDCWPVSSWAALDLGFDAEGNAVARRKPLWYALRSAYADRLLTIQPSGRGWELVLVNDGVEEWTPAVHVALRRLDGTVESSLDQAAVVAARSTTRISLDELGASLQPDPDRALVATAEGAERCVRLLAEDKDAALPPAEFTAEVVDGPTPGVRISASSFVRSVTVFADRVDEAAWADQQMVDLFPGETTTIELIGCSTPPAPDQLTAPVIRAVNDISRSPGGSV